MKHKVSELEGALLDRAVAVASGEKVGLDWGPQPYIEGGMGQSGSNVTSYSPSTNWQQGGQIIQRERIELITIRTTDWRALAGGVGGIEADGPSPLIAAMRAFCASKFGEEVELP